MIDWLAVLFYSLWIGGLSVFLASIGYYDWMVRGGIPSGQRFKSRFTPLTGIFLASCLFCVGLAGLVQSWWERIIWIFIPFLAVLGYRFQAIKTGDKG